MAKKMGKTECGRGMESQMRSRTLFMKETCLCRYLAGNQTLGCLVSIFSSSVLEKVFNKHGDIRDGSVDSSIRSKESIIEVV